ncbi:uncharacterized protein LOC125528275 [Triticum urartu]|uniref:uncharacterized protein LOC125528275 n=1 Tax=Triticum urartu TaxID=4572 RepID=UPI00204436E8|nr:uncharacterized protein LOC125528275 [Triticum urartu]
MTYEGVFYQEEHDDVVRNNEDDDLGYVDLDPNDDDARIDGEAVVNQRDIIMLEKLNEDADDEEEPPPPSDNEEDMRDSDDETGLLIMDKSSGASFLSKFKGLTRSGRAHKGWLRGNAGLPTPPSIEEHKWLIEPVGTENWILRGKGRKPNGLITVLLKEFWPGLFCPRPDRDPQQRVLATSWAHYEACSNAEYGTTAKAVITKFWQLYRVLDEHKARADVVLLAAAKKKARQLQYEVRWVAVSQYYHYYLHQKMTKTQTQKLRLTLSKEQFMMA